MNKIQTTILVPAYNEEAGLTVVLGKLSRLVDDSYEILVIDDGSSDKTAEVARQFPCRVIRHKLNQGKGEALKTGIKQAKGANIIWTDADDSYPVEIIPQMEAALKSHDMIVCSRFYGRGNIPRFNRVGNWLFRTLIRTIYGFKPYDPCTGLYGVKKRHLEKMCLSSKRFAIEPEISIKGSRLKLRMQEIPIEYRARVGSTKLNAIRVGFEDLTTILRLVFWRGK